MPSFWHTSTASSLGQPREPLSITCTVAGSADPPPQNLKRWPRLLMKCCRVGIRQIGIRQTPQKLNFSGGVQN